MKYFMQTICFSPSSYERLGLEKIGENLYVSKEDGSVWKERSLYDLGWGREKGYCRMPELPFEKLIVLAFVIPDDNDIDQKYNYWGSLSVLLDDHCEKLIEYIHNRICNDASFVSDYKHIIAYIDVELNIPDNVIWRLSDKTLQNNCNRWKALRSSISLDTENSPTKPRKGFFSKLFKRK